MTSSSVITSSTRKVRHLVKLGSRRRSKALLGLALAASSVAVVVPLSNTVQAAPGDPPAGVATLTPGSGPLTGTFTISLPVGASCPGDGVAGYRWGTYITPLSNDVGGMVFDGLGSPTGQPAFTSSLRRSPGGEFLRGQTPGLTNGLIPVPIPTLQWLGVAPPAGQYNIGIMCTLNTGGTTIVNTRYWNAQITVSEPTPGTFTFATGLAPAAPVLTTSSWNPVTTAVTVNFTHAASTPAATYSATVTPVGGAPVLPTPIAVAAGATSFQIPNVEGDAEYDVTITATNTVGTSPVSNTLRVTGSANLGNVVVNPIANAAPGAAVTVSWQGLNPAPTNGYNVAITGPGTFSQNGVSGTSVQVPAGTLAAAGTYTATVTPDYAGGPAGVSAGAGTRTFVLETPPPPPPPAPETIVPLTPARVLDTRGAGGGPVGDGAGGGAPRVLRITGQGGVPGSGVSAVALNVTVTDSQAPAVGGFVTVFPCGTRPNASNVNFVNGQTVANSVIAPVSASGDVCFFVFGRANVIVDVSGYFPTGSFSALTPARILDTRGAGGGPVGDGAGGGQARVLRVFGQGGVPSSGVSAVALNVTVTDSQAPAVGGFVTVYPCGTRPNASNVNFVNGQTVANSVIAPVSASGDVCFYVFGRANVIADVSGYFPTGKFSALTPARVLDTRGAGGGPVGDGAGGGQARVLRVTGQGGVPASGVGAVALNVTVTDSQAPAVGGFVTVYPCGTRPNASNVNFVNGQTVANSVIAPVSASGDVCFYVFGRANVIADVSGYFTT
jgi:hypothetical protein